MSVQATGSGCHVVWQCGGGEAEGRVEERGGEGGVVGHGVVKHVGQGPGAGAGVLTVESAGLRQRPELKVKDKAKTHFKKIKIET